MGEKLFRLKNKYTNKSTIKRQLNLKNKITKKYKIDCVV